MFSCVAGKWQSANHKDTSVSGFWAEKSFRRTTETRLPALASGSKSEALVVVVIVFACVLSFTRSIRRDQNKCFLILGLHKCSVYIEHSMLYQLRRTHSNSESESKSSNFPLEWKPPYNEDPGITNHIFSAQ